MRVLIVCIVLVLLGAGGIIGKNYWAKQKKTKEIAQKLNTNRSRLDSLYHREYNQTLWESVENVYERKAEMKRSVTIVQVQKNINQINLINDNELDTLGIFYKYIGLTDMYHALTLLSINPKEQIEYSEKVIRYSDKVFILIDNIPQIKRIEMQKAIQKWIDENQYKLRLATWRFLAMGINFQNKGKVSEEELKSYYENNLKYNNIIVEQGYITYPIIIWLKEQKMISY